MSWSKAEYDENAYTIPDNWLLIHYYEAFSLLFRIENAMRVFVYVILKNSHQEKWIECTTQNDDQFKELRAIYNHRKKISEDFGYIGVKSSSPMMYLSFGELYTLILSERYWPLFKHYFQAKKDVVKYKFDEINTIRNSLAHFRPINENDVSLIINNSQHTLPIVYELLNKITSINKDLPTNTTDEWYLNFQKMSTKLINVSSTQSECKKWISIKIKYVVGVIPKNEKKLCIP